MKITVLMARRLPDAESAGRESIELLRSWGVSVEELHIHTGALSLTDPTIRADLHLLTSADSSMSSYAAGIEARGGVCVNTADVVRRCQDRVLTTGLLAAQGVPVPQTWAAADPLHLAKLLDEGPIALKPPFLSDGAGIQVIWDVDDLMQLPGAGHPIVAQRYHPSERRDRRVYRIGDQVFGVKRTWPARSYEERVGEPFTIDASMRTIADQVSEAIGTDLFGMDVVVGSEGTVVVDVHPFPSFKGVPDAALRLADYIYAVARGEPTSAQSEQVQQPTAERTSTPQQVGPTLTRSIAGTRAHLTNEGPSEVSGPTPSSTDTSGGSS